MSPASSVTQRTDQRPTRCLAGDALAGAGEPDQIQVLVGPPMRTQVSDPGLDRGRGNDHVARFDLHAVGTRGRARGVGEGCELADIAFGLHEGSTERWNRVAGRGPGTGRGRQYPRVSSTKRTQVYAGLPRAPESIMVRSHGRQIRDAPRDPPRSQTAPAAPKFHTSRGRRRLASRR